MRMLEQLQKEIVDIEKKIEAIQSNEGTLFYPTLAEDEPKDIAQSGDGAVQ